MKHILICCFALLVGTSCSTGRNGSNLQQIDNTITVDSLKESTEPFQETIDSVEHPILETQDFRQSTIDNCWSYETQKEYDNAIICWENAASLFPNDYYVITRLANSYAFIQGGYQKALEYSKKALALAKSTEEKAHALGDIGNFYWILGEWDKSSEYFEKAIEIGDQSDLTIIQYYRYLADSYKENGIMDKACETFSIYIMLGTKINDNNIMNSKDQEKFYCLETNPDITLVPSLCKSLELSTIDRNDPISVASFVINSIQCKDANALSLLTGDLGTSLKVAPGTDFFTLGYNNSEEIRNELTTAFSNSLPKCTGYWVGSMLPEKLEIIFTGISINWSKYNSKLTSEKHTSILLFKNDDGIWEMVAIMPVSDAAIQYYPDILPCPVPSGFN